MRQAPRKPNEAESRIEPDDNLIVQTREYELITPLFGGGVEPGQCDDLTPIRGTEIRGHLRFWWRATRGGQFNGDLQKMKAAEDELWGAASTESCHRPSLIQIAVKISNLGREDYPFEAVAKQRGRGLKAQPRAGSIVPPYVAFPLQPDNETLQREQHSGEFKLKSVRAGVKFTLEISYRQPKDDDKKSAEIKAAIQAALWAWETFGGIGARTRRGFGALSLIRVGDKTSSPPYSNVIEQVIKQGLIRHVSPGQWPENVPHLSLQLQLKVMSPQANAVVAWQKLISKLEAFRQFRLGNRFGKSLWPEANAIRRLVSDSPSIPGKFPRAVFGLPIVFHFQHDHDPDDAMLVGWKHERLASPLILRPLICAGNQAIGLAAILTAPLTPPGGLVLENEIDDDSVSSTLTPAEAKAIPPLNGQTDVLNAFLKTL